MKEEIAIIGTTSATEFGDLVSPNEFRTTSREYKSPSHNAASQMDGSKDSGTEP